jgi:hypothetical protein
MSSLFVKLESMRVSHDPGGRVRRALAANVEGYALFGGTRKEYRYVLRGCLKSVMSVDDG